MRKFSHQFFPYLRKHQTILVIYQPFKYIISLNQTLMFSTNWVISILMGINGEDQRQLRRRGVQAKSAILIVLFIKQLVASFKLNHWNDVQKYLK